MNFEALYQQLMKQEAKPAMPTMPTAKTVAQH